MASPHHSQGSSAHHHATAKQILSIYLLLCSGKAKEGTTCSSTANPLKPRVHSLFVFLLVEE